MSEPCCANLKILNEQNYRDSRLCDEENRDCDLKNDWMLIKFKLKLPTIPTRKCVVIWGLWDIIFI